YSAALGLSSEMSLRAIGMKAPGFASAAPAPITATTGDDATLPIFSTALVIFVGSAGRRRTRATQTRRNSPMTTSTIATQVFGLLGVLDAAALPNTNAATTRIPTVAVRAQTAKKNPDRSGRYPST